MKLRRLLALASMFCIIGGANIMLMAEESDTIIEAENKVETLEQKAQAKIKQLKDLVLIAKEKGIDVTREEGTIWFAEFYLKCATWDEANKNINTDLFNQYSGYKKKGETMAEELPDQERQKVITILDTALSELGSEINGEIKRRAIPKIDWTDIKVQDGNFVSGGNIVYPFDYTWRPEDLANDYLGQMSSVLATLTDLTAENENGYSIKTEAFLEFSHQTDKAGMFRFYHIPGMSSYLKTNPDIFGDGESRFTNYDIDNPKVIDMWKGYLAKIMPIADKNYSDFGYMLANEPHWVTVEGEYFVDSGQEGTVSEYTIEKFRSWLLEKHGSIQVINDLWKTEYSSIQDIKKDLLPLKESQLHTAIGYDWSTFNMKRATDWITFLHDEVKKYDPEALTHVKIMAHLFSENERTSGINFEDMANLNEILGDDATILPVARHNAKEAEPWEASYSYEWKEMMAYDFMHSVSPGKAHINSENHFISNTLFRDINMTSDYIRSSFWLAAMHGLDSHYIWVWMRNSDGSITKNGLTGGKSYPATIAQLPNVAHEISESTMDMRAFSKEIEQFQTQRKPIRIFHSESNVMNQTDAMTKTFELYEDMYFDGMPLGFATAGIINNQSSDLWDIILVQNLLYPTDEEVHALQKYLDGGGTIIIDSASLKFDDYKRPRESGLKDNGLGQLIVADTNESMILKSYEILSNLNNLPKIELSETNSIGQEGCYWRAIEDENGFDLFINNVGKTEATVTLNLKDNKDFTIINSMTQVPVPKTFKLQPTESHLYRINY